MSFTPDATSTQAWSSTSYTKLCPLASGGMGIVDLAVRRDGSFERLFAIKHLKPDYLAEPEVRAMFLDEARIAGLMRHPNVVSVTDVGEDEGGPFLVMEFVEGVSAARLIATRSVHPIPLTVALRVAKEVADGLHAAHELVSAEGEPLGLVHRDVSPSNILIGFDGVARVTDFGIAKALNQTSKTATGVLKGKLGYLSPEQLRFEEPDRRADLFALGVVLFEMLTGKRLYKSVRGTDGPRRILTEPPPDLADFRDDAEPELVELLFELLAKDREHRPANAHAVSLRLEAILAHLLTAGDTIETSDFVAQHFAKQREDLRARIREARDATQWAVSKVEAPPAKPRRAIAKGLLAALGLLLLGGGVWLGIRSTASEPKPEMLTRVGSLSVRALSKPPEPSPQASVSPPAPERAAKQNNIRPAAKPAEPKAGVPIWEKY
ncbi:MAG: serine/threonine protein kinase [Myxococcales bacterium]|nr:serine/threonine protein kinase [Myxococcales bacterium]